MKTRTRRPTPKRKLAPNPLRVDPSRTISLLRPLASRLKARFARLKLKLWHLLVTEDAFVLKPRVNPLTGNARFDFPTDPEKIAAFKEWLRAELGKDFLGASDAELWKAYAEAGMKKGLARAFDDTKRSEATIAAGAEKLDFYAGTRDEFLRSAFQQPVAVEKVQLLAGRSFGDMEGVTQQMVTSMTRTLTDGLVQGKGPREIARDMNRDVEGIGQARALTIARTEIVRAHAEGQLVALEKMGVKEVGVMVEWSTAGDGRVCPECEAMAGVVLTIEEAQGQIPLHPNCRCAWIPAGVGEGQAPERDREAIAEERDQEAPTPDEDKTAQQPDEDAEAQERIATIQELDAQHAQAQEEMRAAYLAGDKEGQQEAQDRADDIMGQIRPEWDWLNEHGWVWSFDEGWHKEEAGA